VTFAGASQSSEVTKVKIVDALSILGRARKFLMQRARYCWHTGHVRCPCADGAPKKLTKVRRKWPSLLSSEQMLASASQFHGPKFRLTTSGRGSGVIGDND
jgi:hypothetical protein